MGPDGYRSGTGVGMSTRDDIMKDYVPVNERIAAFYAKHPEGSLQAEIVELNETRVVMRAYAYRTPDDVRPGIGYSSLEIPGRTSYTRGSEIENCETSCWGRAIAALGFEVKRGIASAEEVRNKERSPNAVYGKSNPPPREANGAEPRYDAGFWTASGKASAGKAPVDGELRETPDGGVFGFTIEGDDKKRWQVVAEGPLALPVSLVWDSLVGQPVRVAGEVELVPWSKKDPQTGVERKMPPYRRIHAERIEGPDIILPATVEQEKASAPSTVEDDALDRAQAELFEDRPDEAEFDAIVDALP